MTRAFYPPESLSDEDRRTMAQVRRDIWTAGLLGLVIGSTTGYLGFKSAKVIYGRLSDTAKARLGEYLPHRDASELFSRNVAFLSVMAGGALGSFLLSTTRGKNSVHDLHDIFELGKIDHRTQYQIQRDESQGERSPEHLAHERQQRIAARRNTMRRRIEEGHGLSDSHGGHWLHDNQNQDDDNNAKQNVP